MIEPTFFHYYRPPLITPSLSGVLWKDATALLGSRRLTTRHGFHRPPMATARFNASLSSVPRVASHA